MLRLCVHLFGNFSVRLDDAYVLNFDAPKMQQLFSYLLLRREHTHSREVLASLLWGDSSTAHSKKNLRQTLWQMQAALTMQSVTDDDRVLRVEAEWVQVNPNADIWLDV